MSDHNDHDHDNDTKQPPAPPTSTSEMRGGRMNTVGVPTEKSKDFSASSKRLFRRLGPELRPCLPAILKAWHRGAGAE